MLKIPKYKIIERNNIFCIVTFFSLSSDRPMSRPCATANRLPCTKFPTITEAGPTDVSVIPHPDELLLVVVEVDDVGCTPICFFFYIYANATIDFKLDVSK